MIERSILRLNLHNSGVGPGVEWDVVHLRYEDGGDSDEKRGAVHVDRGANGQDKLGDARVNLVLVVHAAEGDGKGGGPAKRYLGTGGTGGVEKREIRQQITAWT